MDPFDAQVFHFQFLRIRFKYVNLKTVDTYYVYLVGFCHALFSV